MRYINSVLLCTLFATFLLATSSSAQQQPSVRFNEIAWMGTTTSANNEWMELYNTTDQPIDVTGWTIKALDGLPNIILKGTIPARGFFTLERTSEDSAPTLADQIYTSALKNDGERLQLFNANNALIDDVNGWTAGNNDTKNTMARDQNNTWQHGVINGTPNAPNKFFDPPQTNDPSAITLQTQEDTVSNIPMWLGVVIVFVVVGFVVVFVLPHTHPKLKQKDQQQEQESDTE